MLLGFFLLLFSVCVRFLKAFSALYGYRWVCNVLYKQYLHITAHPLCVCRRYASATEVLIPGSLTRFFQIYQLFFLSLSLVRQEFIIIHTIKLNRLYFKCGRMAEVFVIPNRDRRYEQQCDAHTSTGRFIISVTLLLFSLVIHRSLDNKQDTKPVYKGR